MWVPRSIKRGARFWLAGALLWALTGAALAQPLQTGAATSDGRHVLLDDGKVRVLSAGFADESTFGSGVKQLWPAPKGWTDSFLLQDESGLQKVTASSPLSSQTLVPGKDLTVLPWGDNFLVRAQDGLELLLVTPEGQGAAKLSKVPDDVMVLDARRVLVRTGEDFQLMLAPASGATPSLQPVDLPFSAKGSVMTSGEGQVLIWHPTSEKVLQFGAAAASGPATVTLIEPPSLGVKPIDQGYAVSLGAKKLSLISPEGRVQEFPRPSASKATSLAEWTLAMQGRRLLLLASEGKGTRTFLFGGGTVPSGVLPEGTIKAVLPPSDESMGPTLLFMEFSTEEEKLDGSGAVVLDLATGKPMRRMVVGHRVYALSPDGGLVQLAHEPGKALVGPIERLGGRVVYATQAEPQQAKGQRLDVDPRYPQPPVVLHGRSASQPSQMWSYEQPRGQSLSKERLPETHWPRWGTDGPLLLTDENASVLAIDLDTGQRVWSSPELAMDESSPLMLEWKDGLGLISAKGTGRTFTALDPADGTEKASLTLTPFFFLEKWRHLLGVITVCAALGYYIYAAGRRTLYIRKIAGLQALDEAVGRATEMGKPVLYVVGLADVDDIQTMASLSILSHVARKTAEYDTPIVTTTARAVAFSAAQEIVRDAFSVAGRPDAFSVESVRYISDDQFGYTAGVDGIMVREKPAANFYIGNFYAESLILAETGYATGSIQIAGTAQPSQVPFFVAACDYTLIGEELFAASAYLSRDPLQVGSLRGQDVGKAIVMVLLVVCSLLVSFGMDWATVSAWIHGATGVLLP